MLDAEVGLLDSTTPPADEANAATTVISQHQEQEVEY